MYIHGLKRLNVFNLFQGHCAYCGSIISFNAFQVDHVISIARFRYNSSFSIKNICCTSGSLLASVNDTSNLHPSCHSCNLLKKDKSIEEFRFYIATLVSSVLVKSLMFRTAITFGLIQSKVIDILFYFEKVPSDSNQ